MLTFFIDKFHGLNAFLELEIIGSRPLTILESRKVNVDEWFFVNNKIAGPILFLSSLFDACMLSSVLSRL
jgi:hypothetical protein